MRGATPGSDLIRGDEGNDYILGDHGEITQAPGTRRIFSTANVIGITTTNTSLGVADVVYGGAGDDNILGGNGADWLYGGNSSGALAAPFAAQLVAVSVSSTTVSAARFGVLQAVPIAVADRDLIIGDNGQILWTTGLARDLFQTSDTTAATGAADTIEGNEDADVIAGGVGGDTVDAGEGDNVVFGDHGLVDWTPTGPGTAVIWRIESTELSNGGVDIIAAGGGTDVVIGGVGGDQITVGDGRKILLGDSGRIDAAPAAGTTFGGLALTLGRVSSLAPAVGGDDSILAGTGDKIVFGGVGADTITIAGGSNVVLGDNGFLSEIAGLEIDSIVPTDPTIGAGDTITISGSGNNVVIGAAGKDIDRDGWRRRHRLR